VRPFLLVSLSACFSPVPPTGAPCITDADCPDSQVCSPATSTCERSANPADDAADAPTDTSPVGCWASWFPGPPAFDAAVRVDELRVAGTPSSNPSLSFDGLAIYFERTNNPFRATRTSVDDAFSPPSPVGELQTAFDDSRISTTADDSLAVFASARAGTLGGFDLWQATRPSAGAPFGNITAAPFAAINDAAQQFDPEITPDGLHVYWSPPVDGIQTIHHASRASTGVAFGAGGPLPIEIGSLTDVYDPGVSPDQRVLVYAGEIFTGPGTPGDLFYSTRPDASAAFSPAMPSVSCVRYR
jgi:hypothetical protein